ncbi:hypothetical protein ISCGN_003692 [Ixodes scapularis]
MIAASVAEATTGTSASTSTNESRLSSVALPTYFQTPAKIVAAMKIMGQLGKHAHKRKFDVRGAVGVSSSSGRGALFHALETSRTRPICLACSAQWWTVSNS